MASHELHEPNHLQPKVYDGIKTIFVALGYSEEVVDRHLKECEQAIFDLLGPTHRVDWLKWRIAFGAAADLFNESLHDQAHLRDLDAIMDSCREKMRQVRPLKALHNDFIHKVISRFDDAGVAHDRVAHCIRRLAGETARDYKHRKRLTTSEQVLWRLERYMTIDAAIEFLAEAPDNARLTEIKTQAEDEISERDNYLSTFATQIREI